ncbi:MULTISPECIES: SAM-dependent methyltransferase [unclassified Pseudomonas]|uniref:class I SAM-dependent methyltransferase n=1 Tax=unclassified Pseudomonas TaxID=196821 RepID=UPI001472A8AD|nr:MULTISPECIES: SAM-dependent methyltransferase [unclassified Pseudomonas]NMY38560.1 SAM-dependent methyltransferase [Pseudomonas sp. WS 5078]NMY61476.1 SAM-dependent methyltransferase [Pseudomonas sp. WS 5354]
MSVTATTPASAPDHRAQFLNLLETSLAQNSFIKLVLAKYVGPEPELQRVIIKHVTVKEQPCLSFVYRYKTRDITKNFPLDEAVSALAGLLPDAFKNAHLLTLTDEVQLEYSKKGKSSLFMGKSQQDREVPSGGHNREKHRFLDLTRPFLADLGVTNKQQELIPAMSRKWKQINKFIEVFSHALSSSPLTLDQPVKVVDFGSGKGYLTFAIHDYLRHSLHAEGVVTGVELREDMVTLCNNAAQRLEHPGLSFQHGDVRSFAPTPIDVMIALHACDIATDYAIHMGIRSGAAIIMCSPCCHKQIRLQIQSPALLKPMLQYGLHLGQQAEMVTDSLRALFLEACGYETKVFEFISLEHTNKNKMILAVKRAEPVDPAQLLVKIQELKAFYNIQEHCLETLLQADGLLK